MLTTHIKKQGNIFGIFWVLQIFIWFYGFANFYFVLDFANFLFCFMHKVESSKDTWYKLPLVGVLPQASFRLIAADRDRNSSNDSRPSTPPAAAAVFAPWHGISHRRDAAMPEMCLCPECHWYAPAAHLVAVWWHRTREMRLPALQGSALRWS